MLLLLLLLLQEVGCWVTHLQLLLLLGCSCLHAGSMLYQQQVLLDMLLLLPDTPLLLAPYCLQH